VEVESGGSDHWLAASPIEKIGHLDGDQAPTSPPAFKQAKFRQFVALEVS
jgi:hypothetical protein